MPKKLKPLRVLSIDFDYFQNVDAETVMYYPDGHDLPSSLSATIWAHHYANEQEEKRIRTVSINEERINELKDVLSYNAEDDKPVMIAQSHVMIHDFIMEHYKKEKCNAVEIVNIDMHHDMFNDNEKLDCGNWISHVVKAIPKYQLTWIANPISKEVYGLGKNFNHLLQTDFECIKNKDFDIIFLCRSDIWTPPHLDNDFADLYNFILKWYGPVLVDRQIMKPRPFEEQAEELRKVFAEVRQLNSKPIQKRKEA